MIHTRPSKRIAYCAMFACCAFASGTQAALIVYEGFDYPGPALHGASGGTGWTADWQDSNNDFEKVQAGSLTSPASPVPSLGNRVEGPGGTNPSAVADRELPTTLDFSVDGTIFYASFLIKKTTAAGGSQNNVEFNLNNAAAPNIQLLRFGSTTGSQFFLNATTNLGENVTQNETFFVVLKGVSSAASNDQFFANVYDSANSPPVSEPDTWEMTHSQNTSFKMDLLRLVIGNNAGGAFDEIRIGSTWESVTSAVPEPTSFGMLLFGLIPLCNVRTR